jgi:saccharopine dehydrogenase-like NADP-dependent oxidoreductase
MSHDELHSMSVNMDVRSIRFWMGFSEQYLAVFNTLKKIGLLSHEAVTTAEGVRVVPLKVVKACLPDPASLAAGYTGKTCIGNRMRGKKDGKSKQYFIYNVCDHQQCYAEVGSQAISYTAGVPAVAAAMLVADGTWDVGGMRNVEELDPDPFLELLSRMGLPTEIQRSSDQSQG